MSDLKEHTDVPILDDEHLAMLKELDEENPKAFIQDLLDTFEGDWLENLETLKQASGSKDSAAMKQITHLLAGSSGNVGLKRLSAVCRGIENQVDAGVFAAYEECPAQIEKEHESSIAALKEYLEAL